MNNNFFDELKSIALIAGTVSTGAIGTVKLVASLIQPRLYPINYNHVAALVLLSGAFTAAYIITTPVGMVSNSFADEHTFPPSDERNGQPTRPDQNHALLIRSNANGTGNIRHSQPTRPDQNYASLISSNANRAGDIQFGANEPK